MTEYIGEHYLVGRIGHLFVTLSFGAALLSAWFFFSSVHDDRFKKWARITWFVQVAAVLGTIGTIFYMILNQMYEYQYVWQHSNSVMPLKYIFACFWEGQEGSFLLWSFWNVVLGSVLIRYAKEWEPYIMSVFALVQVFLASMLLGILIGDYRWGSSPFMLVREMQENLDMPWTKMKDYMSLPLFKDGRGLNPLLQNYWMTIHPPTLFLGFASTLVPFAYVIAGLWRKKFSEWIVPALPWTFFSVMVLGTGILMGGAWAYESLSFGGFWAWDPVENASLVPWLTLTAGGHVMLIHKSRKTSLGLAFVLILSTFILVLYSTFLTRSGVLGESSVHAFTDLGMSGQLLLFLFAFMLLAVALFSVRIKDFPKEPAADKIYSREFWMFLGALALALSSFHIGFTTSFPVINKIFGTSFAKLEVRDYNKWQTAFAILITFLISVGQYFRYVDTDMKAFRRKMARSFFLSLAITLTASFFFGWLTFSITVFYTILLFTCTFAVLANLDYFIRVLKGKLDHAGPSIAHIGFGMLLLGAVISTGTSKVISVNYKGSVEMLGSDYSDAENIMMTRNDTLRMGDYLVCYKGKFKEGINIKFEIEYMKKDSLTGSITKEFTLYPFIQLNERMGNAAEPDTRHFLHKDIYTHIKYAEINSLTDTTRSGNYGEPHSNSVLPGDTLFSYNWILIYDGLVKEVDTARYHLGKAELAVAARIRVFDFYKNDTIVFPIYYIQDGIPQVIEAVMPEMGLKVALWKIDPETGKVDISFVEKKTDKNDWIVMKAVIFPGINLLWVGCIIMIIGTVMAVRKRLRTTHGKNG